MHSKREVGARSLRLAELLIIGGEQRPIKTLTKRVKFLPKGREEEVGGQKSKEDGERKVFL